MEEVPQELIPVIEKGFRELTETNREILRLLEIIEEKRRRHRADQYDRSGEKVSDTTAQTLRPKDQFSSAKQKTQNDVRVVGPSCDDTGTDQRQKTVDKLHKSSTNKSSTASVPEVHTTRNELDRNTIYTKHSIGNIGEHPSNNTITPVILNAKEKNDPRNKQLHELTQENDNNLRAKKTNLCDDNRIQFTPNNKAADAVPVESFEGETEKSTFDSTTFDTCRYEEDSLSEDSVEPEIDNEDIETFNTFYIDETHQQPYIEDKRVTIHKEMWDEYANDEVEKGRIAKVMHEHGGETIFCLDISSSMKGKPLRQAREFIREKIEDFQNLDSTNGAYEHVALVTFGRETKVQQHLTYEYYEVLTKLDRLRPGGPSPVYAGLKMCEAAIIAAGNVSTSSDKTAHRQLYVISDGRVTPSHYIQGPDTCTEEEQQIEQDQVIDFGKYLHQKHQLAISGVWVGDSVHKSWTKYDEDVVMNDADSIEVDENGKVDTDIQKTSEVLGSDKLFPNLGARVRRKGLPLCGTVTKHLEEGFRITWDERLRDIGTDKEDVYEAMSDSIEVVDEPRILGDKLIAVGCRVKRGPDWDYSNQDGNPGDKGTVLKVKDDGVVDVCWDIGYINSYRYGLDGKFELELVDPAKDCVESKRGIDGSYTQTLSNKGGTVPGTQKDKHTDKQFMWRWKDNKGKWIPYPDEVNKEIEDAYRINPQGTVLIAVDHVRYKILFSRMVKMNLDTREKYPVSNQR